MKRKLLPGCGIALLAAVGLAALTGIGGAERQAERQRAACVAGCLRRATQEVVSRGTGCDQCYGLFTVNRPPEVTAGGVQFFGGSSRTLTQGEERLLERCLEEFECTPRFQAACQTQCRPDPAL